MTGRRAAQAGGVAVGAAVLFTVPAEAATFNVTNVGDAGAGSLRQAIADANAAGGLDTITFADGLTGTVVLTSGQLRVTDSVAIQGPGPSELAVSGNDASRVFYSYQGAGLIDVTITGLTIEHGQAGRGAGIVNYDENLTLDDVRLADNTSTVDGGGLWSDGFSHALTITDSVVTGNTTAGEGGGIYVEDTGGLVRIAQTRISDNHARRGGGVYFYDPDREVRFEQVTISGNTATERGGGIALYDTDGGPFVIDRSTISGNTAGTEGGGIYLDGPDNPVAITNSTISGNTANGAGGGISVNTPDAAGMTLAGVTVDGNATGTPGAAAGIALRELTIDLDGTVVSGGLGGPDLAVTGGGSFVADHALVETPGTAPLTGTVIGGDPQLGPLADNGGPTRTMLPAATSPLLDASADFGLATDQRGVARPQLAAPDIGAVEVAAPPAPPTPPSLFDVTRVWPDRGSAGTTVTIEGRGLAGTTGVLFGSVPASAFVVDGSTVRADAPAGLAGTVDVRVVANGSTTAATEAGRFTFVAPPVAPNGPQSAPNGTDARRLVCGRVPDLTGYTVARAKRVLERDGCGEVPFSATTVKAKRSTAKGRAKKRATPRVVSQTPKPGTPIYAGDTIRVVVRAG